MRRTTSNGKRITAIGVTAGVLGGGAIGMVLGVPALTSATGSSPAVVVEQEDTPTDDTTTDDTTVTETVTDESTSDDATPRPEPGVRLREQLQELVDDGTITSEQADAVATFLVENRPERGGPGSFPGRPGHGRRHDGIGLERGEIAELFGLERDELGDLLRDGQSLADIATAQGVEVQTVIDTLVNASKEHIDEAVSNGRLTQEEADAKLAELTERITEMVNTARPAAD